MESTYTSDPFRQDLTTEIRDHLVIFTRPDIKNFFVTAQYANVIQNHTGYWITIHDDPYNDKSKILFSGKKSLVERIEHVDLTSYMAFAQSGVICDFGEAHSNGSQCPCHGKYKISSMLWRRWLIWVHGIDYPRNCTDEIRKQAIERASQFDEWALDTLYRKEALEAEQILLQPTT